jgi:hypothetical protein
MSKRAESKEKKKKKERIRREPKGRRSPMFLILPFAAQ